MKFKCQDFGLIKDNLYEILATSFSKRKDSETINPNTACMGIRLIDDNLVKIGPYSNTTTYKNLKENNIITINFVNNIYLYALAALKEPTSLINLTEFPTKYYDFKEINLQINESTSIIVNVPFVKKAWGIMICKVVEESQRLRTDRLGDAVIAEFILKVVEFKKFMPSFKLFNRAENLTLEAIILATRLKIAKENEDRILFENNLIKILDYVKEIKRYGKNKKALKSLELLDNYINS